MREGNKNYHRIKKVTGEKAAREGTEGKTYKKLTSKSGRYFTVNTGYGRLNKLELGVHKNTEGGDGGEHEACSQQSWFLGLRKFCFVRHVMPHCFRKRKRVGACLHHLHVRHQ